MKFSGRFARRALAVAALAFTLAAALGPDVALAQAKKNEPPAEEQKGYTLPYFFTIIGVFAAIVPICMPCKRKWDIEAPEEEK